MLHESQAISGVLTQAGLALRCQQSVELNKRISETLVDLKRDHPRCDLAMRAVSLAHEHHSGFLRLMDSEHFATGAAVLRPIAEASTFSHWVSYAAPKEWVAAFATPQAWDQPNLDDMIRALAKCKPEMPGLQSLRDLLRTYAWKRYHSFTHGGVEQLGRRAETVTFNPIECRANFLMADNFLLAGASIYAAWFESAALINFFKSEVGRAGQELKDIFDGPDVPEWKGLPMPVLD
ncbi:MAG: hypothetical protein RR969_09495 [Thermomonas sp.]